MVRRRRRRAAQDGFTLLEVLIALLLGMIGLLGTIAVQQTVLSATQNANDGAVALQLATQQMEQFSVRRTTAQADDQLAPIADGLWTAPRFLDANGRVSANPTPAARWSRRFRVTNTGQFMPYNISVEVTYNLDSGNAKTVRLDVERRKWW